ncbi:hypothetical protein [Yoonia sp. I 8.24]|uniref:hypothetical protein n=1 Tax=Yoonia sp. I 8.24 TaxID=1537229 RepID=UPI001EDE230C|nr:hypothetical protein [Yoonia sp. I 8.24]MCG3266930.1 hypothetical protein [Yoonia sp. I 8.24]
MSDVDTISFKETFITVLRGRKREITLVVVGCLLYWLLFSLGHIMEKPSRYKNIATTLVILAPIVEVLWIYREARKIFRADNVG